MKYTGKRALTLLLALAVLLAWGPAPARADDEAEMITFDEMVYTRPDLEAMEENVNALERALDKGVGYSRVEKLLDEFYARYYDFRTMYILAQIRSSLDLTDSYYGAEYAWCMESYPTVSKLVEDMYYLCGGSPLAGELEEQYFWEGFAEAYGDSDAAVYDEELLGLMQQESALLGEYYALLSSPTIHMDGQEVDYYSYLEHASGSAYDQAMMQYYREYNEEFARLYIALVKVRSAMAVKLGYDNYEQMQYDYYWERDYSPEEAAAYIEDVRTYLVPLYKEAVNRNLYGRISYDYLPERELFRALRTGAGSMGDVIRDAFQFMADYELYDIHYSETKSNDSFQTYLDNYDAPYLFLSPSGTVSDLMTFAHEFGHYVDAYYNYNTDETIDVSETFSQAMEYLMLFYMEDALSDKELDNLYRYKLMETLETYVQQGSIVEFEHAVYSADPETLNADFLNNLSLQTAKDFGYYDGYSREYYSLSWVDISHFFEAPQYVITYPVSNDVALQIFALERQESGAGLAKYLEILPRDYYGLIETAEAGGLVSPFTPGRMAQVAEDMRELLYGERQAA